MAFVVVAHLDRTHVSVLPDLLQKHTRMLVRQARNGVPLRPNMVYVIPPNKEMTLFDGILRLEDAPDHARVNLPIDTLFRSLAADRGPAAVAVVLSGTGSDGTLGLKAIKEEFGMVMVQDEESAQYDGMPRSAAATGLADYVVSPDKMPELLIDYVRRASLRVGLAAIPSEGPPPTALQKIYVLLRARTDHDFSLYKRNTICRRIERRMNVHRIETMDDYARFLRESGREVGILFKELLIGVTNFFREPDAFKTLRDDILIKILEKKPEDYTVRIWVPGCSTGEEAYSLAILVRGSDGGPQTPLRRANLRNRHRRTGDRGGTDRAVSRDDRRRRGARTAGTAFRQGRGRALSDRQEYPRERSSSPPRTSSRTRRSPSWTSCRAATC